MGTGTIPYIGLGVVLLAIVVLLIVIYQDKLNKRNAQDQTSIQPEDEENQADLQEKKNAFEGLLEEDDFEYEHENPLVELYRRQWVRSEAGIQKDQYMLSFLAFKQLDREKNAKLENDEDIEWTDEQTSARLDEVLHELSEKSGIPLPADEQELFELEKEMTLSELDDLVEEELPEEEFAEETEDISSSNNDEEDEEDDED